MSSLCYGSQTGFSDSYGSGWKSVGKIILREEKFYLMIAGAKRE
jgi:hypothetical protein